MLQQEHEKAQKKIQETSAKTEELINLRKRNDERYLKQQLAQEERMRKKYENQLMYEEQKARRAQVQNAKLSMYT